MNGRSLAERFPYVSFRFRVGDLIVGDDALLDTGFDGDLVLPRRLIPPGFRAVGEVALNLADGSGLVAPAYVGRLTLDALEVPEAVPVVLGDEPLIGINAIRSARVILDRGRRVEIEP